jgi:predicted nucleic acid-binding protein
MSALEFLDSNVLIYAYDETDPHKQSIAQQFVVRALAGQIVASSQVLAEFAVTLLHKLSPAPRTDVVLSILNALGPVKLVPIDADTIRRAVEAHATYGIHFYDGMIIAAAERAGCSRIWSEDLNPGQRYFGVAVQNPFGALGTF